MTGHVKSEHWIARYISAGTHHLPAALMVTAVVTICHHGLHLLDAIDGYAYLAIGNLTANSISWESGNDKKVPVVLIDQQSNEDFYRERSPLNRCELKKDLEAIYKSPGPPKLLVVDLDLSPPLPVLPLSSPENTIAQKCTDDLISLFKQYPETRTVLIAPFKMLDTDAQAEIEKWRKQLEGIVSFADPTIRVRYGLVNGIKCNAHSLAAIAYEKYPDKPANLENCRTEKSKDLKISPGQYFSGLRPVSLCQLSSRRAEKQCAGFTPYEALNNLPVVFVGTSFGDGDTFLTPLGTMYGVEVHAAAFMSLLQPTTEKEGWAFVLDVALGLGMGGLIAGSWRRYFSLRFSSSAFERQRAPWLILGRAIVLVVLLLPALTLVSFLFLRCWNIWLSPIPIAVGMLIESFFNSAVSAAVGEGYEQRQALIRRLHSAHTDGPDSFASQVALETEQRPHHAHSLQERAARFFYLDCQRLRSTRQYSALKLLRIRRGVFFLLLLLALFWDQLLSLVKRLL